MKNLIFILTLFLSCKVLAQQNCQILTTYKGVYLDARGSLINITEYINDSTFINKRALLSFLDKEMDSINYKEIVPMRDTNYILNSNIYYKFMNKLYPYYSYELYLKRKKTYYFKITDTIDSIRAYKIVKTIITPLEIDTIDGVVSYGYSSESYTGLISYNNCNYSKLLKLKTTYPYQKLNFFVVNEHSYDEFSYLLGIGFYASGTTFREKRDYYRDTCNLSEMIKKKLYKWYGNKSVLHKKKGRRNKN